VDKEVTVQRNGFTNVYLYAIEPLPGGSGDDHDDDPGSE
jgi:hypothetical protein